MTSSKPFLAVLNHVLEFQARVGTLDFGDPMTLQTWNQNLIMNIDASDEKLFYEKY